MGGMVSAYGQLKEGEAKSDAASEEAKQLDIKAEQLRAQGQLEGEEELRQSRLIQSRILAVAGASGAGVVDPTVMNLIGVNAAEGSLAAATRRYTASSKAQDMNLQAAARRREGWAHAYSSKFQAFGTAMSSFGSMGFGG